jgi:hypothetical protein
MREYFQKMNLLHLSYAAYPNAAADVAEDYLRARRYPTNGSRPFGSTEIEPSYERTGFFAPGIPQCFIVAWSADELFFHVSNYSAERLFHWKIGSDNPPRNGFFGILHMAARASR